MMVCPYLLVPVIHTCLANEKSYEPTVIQLREYCNQDYYKCPFYRYSGRRLHEETSPLGAF
jgi:hypothetical protein